MKRKLTIALSLFLLVAGGLVGVAKLAIRHDRLALYDAKRQRSVPVDIYVRRDVEMKAAAGMSVMPVAIVNHGNTVANSEYSFLANTLAARGYLVASIQHDLPGDAPLSQVGFPYVGRVPAYQRGEANILFVIDELKKLEPNSNFEQLTLVGHSNGGDISVFFAHDHPEITAKVVTLDNLRVPLSFVKGKILSFRSRSGSEWKPDPGVVPDEEDCEKAGIEVVRTAFQHTDMSDRGPSELKEKFTSVLANFLNDADLPPVVREKKAYEKQVATVMDRYFPVTP